MKRYISLPNTNRFADEYVEVVCYPDGETSITVPEIGISDDIVLIGSCPTAQASETFLAAAMEIASYGPASLTVVNTYFRHARSDRKVGRQAVMAKFQARQWSALGVSYPGVRLVFVDLHNDLVLSYFEGPVRTSNLSVLPLLEKEACGLWGLSDDVVYATVDLGGVYEARALAENRGCGFAHIDKKRINGSKTVIRAVHGDNVNGRDVIIFDDMISTGGSLIEAAAAYRERGARRVYAVACHGLFVGDAVDRLLQSGIEAILVTDSHPSAMEARFRASMDSMGLNVYPLSPRQLAPAA